MIYAIRAGDFVKIGYTSDNSPVRRLKSMQTACPYKLTIAAYGPGSRSDEYRHHMFLRARGNHYRGEWFKAGKDTDWVIDQIRSMRPTEVKKINYADIPTLGSSRGRLGKALNYSKHIASNLPERRSRTTRTPQALQPDQGAA